MAIASSALVPNAIPTELAAPTWKVNYGPTRPRPLIVQPGVSTMNCTSTHTDHTHTTNGGWAIMLRHCCFRRDGNRASLGRQ